MKKSIVFISLLLIILCISTFAQAAAISTSTPTIKVGQNATIKVTTTVDVYSMEFTITYDETKFDYVTNSAAGVALVNDTTPGTLIVSYTSLTGFDTLSFTFKAIATGTGTFGITAAEFFDATATLIPTETITTASTTVVVTAATTGNNTTPEQIPNAGFDFIPIIIAVVLIVGFGLFLKFRNK